MHKCKKKKIKMFSRINKELSFEILNVFGIQNETLPKSNTNFMTMINNYNENFIIISQKERAAFLNLTLSDIIRFFSMPSCTKDDGKTSCKPNCDCFRSLEIGMQIYDKGGVQSFNQFGNHLIGYLIEQQTDPMTRISIEMDSSMKQIKKIYCPCKFHYCPHAFALLYFRIKLPAFYAIRLPEQSLIFLTQNNSFELLIFEIIY
jgi:hypothetical protein